MSLPSGPRTGLPPEGFPSLFLFSSTPLCFCLPISRVLAKAVLPGLGSRTCRKINKASAFCSTGSAAFGLATSLSPRRPLGVWKNGCGWRGWQSARQWGSGSPPHQGFGHPWWACLPLRVSLLQRAGLGVWATTVGKPLGAPGLGRLSAVCWRWWQEHPILHCVGRLALEWAGNCLFFPFLWRVLLPSPQGGAARLGRAQARGSTGTP